MTVPDGLGGWHVIQLLQDGKVMAQEPYFVKRSVVGISTLRMKAGTHFTVHLKGVGWTQLDNTIAVDYDNSYVGYGCGFNSNGDVVLNLIATGGPGTHLIDMYPLLYTQQPSYANTPYGMVPVLDVREGLPGPGARVPASCNPPGRHRGQVVRRRSRWEEGPPGPSSCAAATSCSGRSLP